MTDLAQAHRYLMVISEGFLSGPVEASDHIMSQIAWALARVHMLKPDPRVKHRDQIAKLVRVTEENVYKRTEIN